MSNYTVHSKLKNLSHDENVRLLVLKAVQPLTLNNPEGVGFDVIHDSVKLKPDWETMYTVEQIKSFPLWKFIWVVIRYSEPLISLTHKIIHELVEEGFLKEKIVAAPHLTSGKRSLYFLTETSQSEIERLIIKGDSS